MNADVRAQGPAVGPSSSSPDQGETAGDGEAPASEILAGMSGTGRRDAMVSYLRSHGETMVRDLPAIFGVSVETVRRDLRVLENARRISRSYGKVVATDSSAYEHSQEFRLTHLTDEKERIAAAAVRHLAGAESIFLDEGYQPLLVGRALPDDRPLTIITACLPIAMELVQRPRMTVIMVGGRVRPVTSASVDRWATAMLRGMEPDLAIIGANGVGEDGWLTTPDPAVAEVKETVIGAAQRRIFVGSHTKFGHRTLTRFGHLRDFERVVTGRELRAVTARRLGDYGPVIERV